jgi:hypothetical protein
MALRLLRRGAKGGRMAYRSDERSRPDEGSRGDRTGDRGPSEENIRGGSDESIRGIADDEDDEFEEVDETEDDENDADR